MQVSVGYLCFMVLFYVDFILIFEIQLIDWSDTTIDDISYTTTSPS